jgi:hypothetical protein
VIDGWEPMGCWSASLRQRLWKLGRLPWAARWELSAEPEVDGEYALIERLCAHFGRDKTVITAVRCGANFDNWRASHRFVTRHGPTDAARACGVRAGTLTNGRN